MKLTGTHLGIVLILLFFTAQCVYAGDEHNHVHIDQVADGDNANINITQIGYDNHIDFTFAHANNTFNLSQQGMETQFHGCLIGVQAEVGVVMLTVRETMNLYHKLMVQPMVDTY